MSELSRPYLPGRAIIPAFPLDRYLPTIQADAFATWLEQNIAPGSWVLDPFGSHPQLALEAARRGYRVLVASNNPVLTFLLETLASAPPRAEFQSALSALLSLRRGDERLERQIESLYVTRCDACGEAIQPQAYIWQRDAAAPHSRLYTCPHCGDEGERPVTQDDLDRLARLGDAPLARARAMERVGVTEPAQKEVLDEVLKAYLTRPLHVLFTLLNKAEGIDLPLARKRLLTALLLSLADEANTLWPYPAGRARPRQLTVPPQLRENNLWLALDRAVEAWSSAGQPALLTSWPELPPSTGGICLHAGRVRDLLPLAGDMAPAAVLAAFPRPNQAFWTLSAVWSGWLWGRESVAPLKSALERLHYDWYWHANALNQLLSALHKNLPTGTRLFGMTTETYPGLVLAVLSAARTAGFQILGMSYRPDQEIAQFSWRSGAPARALKTINDWNPLFEHAITEQMEKRAEPVSYMTLLTACVRSLIEQHALPLSMDAVRTDLMGNIQNSVNVALRNRSLFIHYPGPSRSAESGSWWLQTEPANHLMPLYDRVEMEVVRFLQKNPVTDLPALDLAICARFPGLQTPARELVEICLDSYAEVGSPEEQLWQLRQGESPEQRRRDISEAEALIRQVGQRLGFEVTGENPLVWSAGGTSRYSFYVLASSVIGRFFLVSSDQPGQRVLVMPGGRSRLLAYKLEQDPRLTQAAAGWRFLKFRHLRRLADKDYLTPESWDDLLDQDQPSGEDAVQMRMF